MHGHGAGPVDPRFHQPPAQGGRHDVEGARQADDVPPRLLEVVDQIVELFLVVVAPVQGDEEGLLHGDPRAHRGNLNAADAGHQFDLVDALANPVEEFVARYVEIPPGADHDGLSVRGARRRQIELRLLVGVIHGENLGPRLGVRPGGPEHGLETRNHVRSGNDPGALPGQEPAVAGPHSHDGRAGHRARTAASTSATCPFTLTFRHSDLRVPVSSIRKVDRSIPMYFLPYMDFSTQAP